jgi:hypothetical protein
MVARSPVERTAKLMNAEIHFKPLEIEAILDLTVRLIDSAARD